MIKKIATQFFRVFSFFAVFLFLLTASTGAALAQEHTVASSPEVFLRAQVVEILEEGQTVADDIPQPYQKVQLKILDGAERGQIIAVEQGKTEKLLESLRAKKGETVVVAKVAAPEGQQYFINDKYRLPSLGAVLAIFFLAAVVFGGWRGAASLLGLIFTVLILVSYIVPSILAGQNPLFVTIVGSLAIIFLSMYPAHGFNRRTSVALLATALTLMLAVILATAFISLSKLFGTGSEEAFYVARGVAGGIDFRGLLLAGILIGVLGVLDDITTGQSAAVDEIFKANPSLSFRELYRRGVSVGREHIASLVNTLVLAYAGASLPLFILFISDKNKPVWVTLNNETMATEIIRTLVGSATLVLAVPFTTLLAAYLLRKRKKPKLV